MTPEEEKDLRAMSADIAAAEQSGWQPGAIARAFASASQPSTLNPQLALTMQGWIDLDHARSPLLAIGIPAEITLAEVDFAAGVFGMESVELTPAQAAPLLAPMIRACEAAFAAALRMSPSQPSTLSSQPPDGFGDWMPLLTMLMVEAHLSLADALALRVDAAFILAATIRRNQGWEPAGVSYALRDVKESAVSSQESAGSATQLSTLNAQPPDAGH